jgi:hypothetical protein
VSSDPPKQKHDRPDIGAMRMGCCQNRASHLRQIDPVRQLTAQYAAPTRAPSGDDLDTADSIGSRHANKPLEGSESSLGGSAMQIKDTLRPHASPPKLVP